MLACGPANAFATARHRCSSGPISTSERAVILNDSVSRIILEIAGFSYFAIYFVFHETAKKERIVPIAIAVAYGILRAPGLVNTSVGWGRSPRPRSPKIRSLV